VIPPEKALSRAAERLVGALVKGQLLAPSEPQPALEKRVLDAIKKNFQEEAALQRDAEKILEENRRQMAGMDQRTLLSKIREKLARERGFVL
jgi:hypothetical protein